MRKTVFIFAAVFILFIAPVVSVYAQESSSANLKLVPSQERIPKPDRQPLLPPEHFIPPIGSPPSSAAERRDAPPPSAARNSQPFKAPVITSLERGKWYVQIGAYARAAHVEEAINRAGTSAPIVIHSVGTAANPMYRVLLGPFSQSESKTVQQRFRGKGYDAFLRNGN